MDNLKKIFNGKKNSVLLIFPHLDDCAFVSSGLIQMLRREKLDVHVAVMYEEDDAQGVLEFEYYSKLLDISETSLVKTTHKQMSERLGLLIKKIKPSFVVTFDPGGVTGNTHHTLLSLKLYEVISNLKERPILLWRIADKEEEKFFGKMPKALGRDFKNILTLTMSFSESLKKVKAILANKSKMNNFFYKLRIIEWYLFDHKELYYMVDFKKDILKINYPKMDD